MRLETRTRRTTVGLMLAAIVALAACTAPPRATATEVDTDVGRLRGSSDGEVVRYVGVPFAEPPVGDGRFAPPRPIAAWDGVRDATTPGDPCPQNAGDFPTAQLNEDCLHLEVTAPAAPGRDRPVLVFVHGGSYLTGSGSTINPPTMVTRGDVVVVAINYRLNGFGFLALPGMTGGGQFGLADQQEALRFVQRNAAAFGGDPDNVTLFGESGGAISTCAQLTSPSAAGLFDRAIMQSPAGACANPVGPGLPGPGIAGGSQFRPLPEREHLGLDVLARLGCPDPATVLTCARALPVEALLGVADSLTFPAYGGPDAVLPRSIVGAIADGEIHDVPVLSGFNRDEPLLLLNNALTAGLPPLTAADHEGFLRQDFGDRADEVLARYPVDDYESPNAAWNDVYSDRTWACPQMQLNDLLAAHNPVWGYELTDPTAPLLYGVPHPSLPSGAAHGSDIAYLFEPPVGTPEGSYAPLTPDQLRLSERMIDVWTRFARTGDPGLPAWTATERVNTDFGGPQPVVDSWTGHRCDFWAETVAADIDRQR